MKISPMVFIIPLFVATALVAGAFIYKNMLTAPKAAEPKAVINPTVYIKPAGGKPSTGFGGQAGPPTKSGTATSSAGTEADQLKQALKDANGTASLDDDLESLASEAALLQ